MKHSLLLLPALLLLPCLLRAQTYQQVKVHASPERIVTIASLGIAVDDGTYRNGIWETVLSAGEVMKLKNADYSIDIIIGDYSKFIRERNKSAEQDVKEINRKIRTKNTDFIQYPVPMHFELGSMGGYYSPIQVLNELDSMRLFYPALISQKTAVGSQQTIEGRDVYCVRISNTPDQNTNKPKIQYNSLTHAREPMGMQQMMFFMWYLLENYTTNEEVKYLVDNLELYFIPVMNPDGFMYNYITDPAGGGMWRKNRRNNGSGEYGVDLNRNFGYKWGYDNYGSSPDPWSETYRGPSAFSEFETQDFREFCVDKKFKFAYNYHTYANETLYPWCYVTEVTPDSLTEYAFTEHMMAENGYVCGPAGLVLYNTNGDAMDWEYGDSILKPRIICFTTETGNNSDGFWPAPDRIVPLAEENMYANLQAAELTLPYAEITDFGPVINSRRDGFFPFQFKRLGLTDSTDYTITIKPLDSLLFVSVGPPKIIHYPAQHTVYTDSIGYSLVPGLQIGQSYRYIWQINNGMTTFRDTVKKYFGWETTLLSDSCNTMNNWTSAHWNTSNKTSHSSALSITDSPSGSYTNNTYNTMTLKNKITILQSPVAVIEYWVRYSLEKNMDYCQFTTSLDNGSTWTKQSTRYTNNGSTEQDFPYPVYDGYRNWSQDRVVLKNTIGKDMLVKFVIGSNSNGYVKDGFYLDDFKVTVIDMTYNMIDPTGTVLGFISAPVPNPSSTGVSVKYQLPGASSGSGAGPGVNYPLPGASSGSGAGPSISFQLLDTRGILLKEIPITSASGTVQFNVSDFPAGIYLYRIIGSFGTTAVKKLVVAH